jgi:NTP pyrophosphatase (non-canonical NTP hydrolase)
MTTLNEIADVVHENAKAHGFHDPNEHIDLFIANQSNNLHEEVSELWSAHRAGISDDLCDKADKMVALGLQPLTNREEEYADIIIRALDQCRRLGVDIQRAIEVKHAYNKTRPFKHGKRN